MRILGTCAVALFALAPMGALAAPIDPLALMRGTSVIALGDLTTESSADGANHLEGPAYIGGDLISVPGSYAANQDGLAPITVGSATGTLIIGGSTSADIDGAQRGDVVLGGSHTGLAGTATVHDNVDGIPLAEMTRVFQALSGNLAGLDTTAGAALDLSNPWNPLFT
ncbi:hypothetical protein EU800_03930 [Tropicimonas sp. IMCC6043]|nr:collagen-binding domain-containing protein [Tropicimonas sp. IMCC6043]RYH11791.1 hypothetical protein EU800_03930 [Tropicimonas sp. IMCC6043]